MLNHEEALRLLVWVSERIADNTDDTDIVAGIMTRVNTQRASSDLAKAYSEWTIDRLTVSAREASGKFPAADDWHDSDDSAVELLREAMAALADGHCLDCGNAFSDSTYGPGVDGFCTPCGLGKEYIAEDAVRDGTEDD